MRRYLGWLLFLLLCGCGGGGGGGTQPSGGGSGSNPAQMTQQPNVTLVGVEFSPASLVLAAGLSADLQLFAVYSNGIRVDVTAQATFTSATPSAVTLSSARATAVRPGSSQITGQFQSTSAQMTVQVAAATLSSLRIDPSGTTLPAGQTQQFRAFGTFSDNSTSELTSSVAWSVETRAIARVESSPVGLVTALQPGTTRIVANLQGRSASADLVVTAAVLRSLEISPNPLSLPIGIGQQFVATGVFSDGSRRTVTSDVSWGSSDSDTFLISDQPGSKGLGAGLRQGVATLSATSGSISTSAQITVTAAVLQSLTLSPQNPSLANGLALDFQANGQFSDGQTREVTAQVIWSSSAEDIALISNLPGSTGRALGRSPGETTITATLNGVSQSTRLTVTSAVLQRIDIGNTSPSLAAGLTRSLNATGAFSDGSSRDITDQTEWISDDETVAQIDRSGLLTARKTGSTLVRARLNGVEGTSSFTVSQALLESLSLEPLDSQLPLGLTRQFRAMAHYSDNSNVDVTQSTTWTSATPEVASISNAPGSQGQARSLSLGSSQIQAQFQTVSARTDLEVTASIPQRLLLSPTRLSLPVGLAGNPKAVAVFSDGKQVTVTDQVVWRSDAPEIAQVDALGRVSALSTGRVSVSASLGSLQASLEVAVEGTVTSLQVVTGSSAVSSGSHLRFYALATLSNGRSRDVTDLVSWSVTPSTLGTISQGQQRPGELAVASAAPSSGQVQASLPTILASRNVSRATASALYALPGHVELLPAMQRPVRVFSNNLVEFRDCQWTSSNTSVARVTDGSIVAVGAGNATLSARRGATTVMNEVLVHVGGGTPAALEVTAPTGPVPPGAQGSARAQLVTSDGERFDVSQQADWSSSAPDSLLVSQGRLEGRNPGSAQITATYENLTGSATATSAEVSAVTARFVDSSQPAGGDGSQAHPYNNLAEAFAASPAPTNLFLFSGEGAGDGHQYPSRLPSPLDLRGQQQGWNEVGIAAGPRPQTAMNLQMNDNTLVHGLAAILPTDLAFTTSGNATVDDLDIVAVPRVVLGDINGECRILNSQLTAYQAQSGTQAIHFEPKNPALPGQRSLEIGNVTVTHRNATNGFLSVDGYADSGVSPFMKIHVHDNIDQFLSGEAPPVSFAAVQLEAARIDLSVTNNTGPNQTSQFSLVSGRPLSQIEISGNRLRSINLDIADCSGPVRLLDNQLISTGVASLTVNDQYPPFQPEQSQQLNLRVDNNQVTGTAEGTGIFVNSFARVMLLQNNVISGGSIFLTAGLRDFPRLLGFRGNQIGTGTATLQISGSSSNCLAVTDNQAANFRLTSSSTLVVEGLSILSTLNQFGTIFLSTTFVEAPVDSCGIPF